MVPATEELSVYEKREMRNKEPQDIGKANCIRENKEHWTLEPSLSKVQCSCPLAFSNECHSPSRKNKNLGVAANISLSWSWV